MSSKASVTVTFRIPVSISESVADMAGGHGISRSEMLRQMVVYYCTHNHSQLAQVAGRVYRQSLIVVAIVGAFLSVGTRTIKHSQLALWARSPLVVHARWQPDPRLRYAHQSLP